MSHYTTIKEQVEYGLEAFAKERTVEVPLQDLLYVNQAVGELVRFFHQPLHYPDLASVERFLGNKDEGMLQVLFQCYYEKLRDIWPPDVMEKIEDGELDNPDLPFYYQT